MLDHPIYLHRIGIIKLKSEKEDQIEHFKNILRLSGRVIDILLLTIELHFIQKEIKTLVITNK